MTDKFKTLGKIDKLIIEMKEDESIHYLEVLYKLIEIRNEVCDLIVKLDGLEDFKEISEKWET